ncbi:MAG: tRNA glutamyl-Q(34) synthetase GluQRS [Kangiellaceae bacterium]|nr:tRNA glutamyl-Q(34) synthetase GluQRS [Kangiellaceae bacterium]
MSSPHLLNQTNKPIPNKHQVGRFAPSPSGPLHFGSLVAALGSYLIAKSDAAKWLVRIEDIDPPREIAGASDTILRQLEAFGLHWDGDITYQSQHLERFEEILNQLKAQGLLYACHCTRKQIAEFSHSQSIKHGLYPNICANKNLAFDGTDADGKGEAVAWKLRHGLNQYSYHDAIQGHCQFDEALYREDFTVKRKDGLIAYQLAVVVDDIEQNIDHVVRGCDLLDSTPRQLRLYEVLGQTAPDYYHLPLAINQEGNKLSKQNHAPAIEAENASVLLCDALSFLGQNPDPEWVLETPTTIISYAIERFSLEKIPQKQQISYLPRSSD